MLLTTGEQVSVSLMAMAMQSLDVPAVSLNAFQVQMHSTERYGNARFKRIDTDRITHELDSRKIVIVTGFQGVNKYDDLTTLGRGGSDTTAVALAAALHADRCEIFTDVDGVYTADPRIVKNAMKLDEVTYDEMLELASLGAKVLHNRSVEMAKKYGVELVVRSRPEPFRRYSDQGESQNGKNVNHRRCSRYEYRKNLSDRSRRSAGNCIPHFQYTCKK